MTEAFLHYVWQFQYFDKRDLATETGELVEVFNPGLLNADAGPDFLNARVRIGGIDWIGNVEIHIQASGWRDHKHDSDPAYDNVILHVVWTNDWTVVRRDGSTLPVISLDKRIAKSLILKYTDLISTVATIPCASQYPSVDKVRRLSMMDRALVHRLEKKSDTVIAVLNKTNHDWEETLYQLLCANFGFKVNTEPFRQLACALPLRIVWKHSTNLVQIEALLFGLAGILQSNYRDGYFLLLRREFEWLERKYNLGDRKLNPAQWRFLRLRPANFPTLRIAQLAVVLHHHPRLFSRLLEIRDIKTLRSIFAVEQSEFWLRHYRFGLRQNKAVSPMGAESIDNIIVNTVVPVLAAYGKVMDEQHWLERCIAFLKRIPGEQNSITRKWRDLGEASETAFDSQALIELYNDFCYHRRCLNCTIGAMLVKPGS